MNDDWDFMKKHPKLVGVLVGFIIIILIETATYTATHSEDPYRFDTGIYMGHGRIITLDGNEWFINDLPATEKDTLVKVIFDTKKTKSLKDDEIVWVKNNSDTYEYIRED